MFIFQSFISTNVRQCYCPPSIDPQRGKEMGGERERDRERQGGKWGKAVTRNKVEREVGGGMRERRSSSEKAGMR